MVCVPHSIASTWCISLIQDASNARLIADTVSRIETFRNLSVWSSLCLKMRSFDIRVKRRQYIRLYKHLHNHVDHDRSRHPATIATTLFTQQSVLVPHYLLRTSTYLYTTGFKNLTPAQELPNSQNATPAKVCTTSSTTIHRKIRVMAIHTTTCGLVS